MILDITAVVFVLDIIIVIDFCYQTENVANVKYGIIHFGKFCLYVHNYEHKVSKWQSVITINE